MLRYGHVIKRPEPRALEQPELSLDLSPSLAVNLNLNLNKTTTGQTETRSPQSSSRTSFANAVVRPSSHGIAHIRRPSQSIAGRRSAA